VNYICKKIEILYCLICFINYYLPLCSTPILTPADIMAPNNHNAPNAPKKPINPNRRYDTEDITIVSYLLFPECPGAPRPARGEMKHIDSIEAVACQLFPDIHGAPRKTAIAPVHNHMKKCGACRQLKF
jgi:hypothetical protein